MTTPEKIPKGSIDCNECRGRLVTHWDGWKKIYNPCQQCRHYDPKNPQFTVTGTLRKKKVQKND